MDYRLVGYICGFAASLVLSGFFSMSEAALLSVNKTRIRYLAERGDTRAALVRKLMHEPKKLLATILIGNNIVNTLAAVWATAIAQRLFDSFALSIAAGITTFLLLFFGEVTPKTLANEHSEWVSLRIARPIRVFESVFWFIEVGLNWLARPFLRYFTRTHVKPSQFHTQDEIRVLLRVGKERGHIAENEAKLIKAVFEFHDLELADVMVPHAEVSAVREVDPLTRIVELVAQTGHSRFPVLDDARHPLGLLYAKDLLVLAPEQLRSMHVSALIRAIPQFPPDYHVGNALEKMQKEAGQMAAVIDSSGALVGIVTVEDLLEQIVGEITDEYELARRRMERERAKLALEGKADPPAASVAPPGNAPSSAQPENP